MLELLGTIGANVLGLPGILGVAAGMATRNWAVAAIIGAVIGAVEAMIFAGFDFANAEATEFVISVVVGVIAAIIGCAIRHKGATV